MLTSNDRDRSQPIKVLYWNCNGISGKRHHLELLLQQYKPDIFALSESKLISSVSDKEVCDKYTLYRHDRVNSIGRGGGVLIGILDTSNIKVNNVFKSNIGEILSLELDVCGYSFTFAVYYRRPVAGHVDDFIDWYNLQTSCNHIIVGDFNLPEIDWKTKTLKSRHNPTMHESFLDLIETSDLEQLITDVTHIQGNTLDLVLTNLDASDPIIEPTCSDHHAIVFDLNSEIPIAHAIDNNNTTPYWLFKKANIPNLMIDCYDLDTAVSEAIDDNCGIENVWNIFKTGILDTASRNIPSRCRKANPNPWMTKETDREIQRRRRWLKTSRIYNTEENKNKLRHQSRYCDKLINRDYNNFINRHICDKLESGDTKPLFKFIANRRGNSNTVKQLDGCSDDSSYSIAERFAKGFCSVFTVDDGNQPTCQPSKTKQTSPITINPNGILKQLRELDKKKGAGPDGLSPALLQFLSIYIYKPLSNLFQYSLDTGNVPHDWREANVVPLYKKGSRTDPLNYRPISLTSIISKILEHVISHDINSYLETNGLFADCQHGFRRHHGCETQLLTTITDLTNSYDLNIPTDIAVLDFQKAFDVVSHPKLILKLFSSGIHPSTIEWIRSWLSHRNLAVTVNGVRSQNHKVSSGVPQGSVLGPLLFLLFINDMPDSIHFSNLRLFADDSLLYKQIVSDSDSSQLQEDLDNLATWAETWQMSFNTGKCEHMRVARPTKQHDSSSIPEYSFSNDKLSYVNNIKYLGVFIDNQLSFDRHISEVCKKATSTLHMLMRNLKRARKKTRTIAYKTICRPILEYASQSWCPYKSKHIKSIEAINRKAFRWANFKKKFDRITDMMAEEGWQSLVERRHANDIKMYFKILSGTAAIDETKVATQQSSYMTRVGATQGVINTNVQRYSFKHRVHNLLNPSQHRLSGL